MKTQTANLALKLKSWPTTTYCIFVGSIGLMLLITAAVFTGSTGWGKDLFAPGATLMTVALTGYIAARGVVTWAEQRNRDREVAEYKHRESVYEEIVVFMLGQFGYGSYDRDKDVALRAKAALWAGEETMLMLSRWQSMLGVIIRARPPVAGADLALFPMESAVLKALFGATVLAMRSDLSPESGSRLLNIDSILDSMFND